MSPSSEPRQCVLVLPTYNEIENIDRFIRAVRSSTPHIHVLIVDDNSPDGTGDAADNLARELGNMHVIHRTNERGLGSDSLVVLCRDFQQSRVDAVGAPALACFQRALGNNLICGLVVSGYL